MMGPAMTFPSAIEQLAALRARRTSSVELTMAAIEYIEQTDTTINAVVVRDFDRALEAAKAADAARHHGDDRRLLGLPLTVKEAFDVEGLPTSWGLSGKHTPAKSDAVLIERLRSAGAVILGKTNVATMLSDWQTVNPVFGVTNNPWNIERTPGGSSGGGSAAVASGMSPLDFGSDLAGSLRIPAAFCGVYAHRPSYAIVPTRGFAPPMAPRREIAQQFDQSTVGPIARTADDLKLALDVVAGADQPDATAWQLNLPPTRHVKLQDFRVLILDKHPLVPTSEGIRARIDEVAKGLEKAGCKVGRNDKEVPDPKNLQRTFAALLMSVMGVDMSEETYAAAAKRANGKGGKPEDQSLTMSHRDWVNLDRHRLAFAEQWMSTFRNWDVLLCPAAPRTAFRHDERPFDERKLRIDGVDVDYHKIALWTTLATPTGLPVTSAPVGLDANKLPIGVQIIGPRFEDYTPIAFATELQTQLGYGFVAPDERSYRSQAREHAAL
jgi:amidase